MEGISCWVISVSLILLIHSSNSVEEAVKQSLLDFFQQLNDGKRPTDPNFGWNSTSDPCLSQWRGITCSRRLSVKKVVLEGLGFTGVFDANSICAVPSLIVLSIQNNRIHGEIPEEIVRCKQFTHLYINDNQFSGNLPASLSLLNNLKRLFIENNNFIGELPDLPKISGLISFLAQYNQFSGEIPKFDFTNLVDFNVSFNNFSGPIPDLSGRFGEDSFLGNSRLCGKPLLNACPPSSEPTSGAPPPKRRSKQRERILMYVGYILIALIIVLFFVYKIISRKKNVKKSTDVEQKRVNEGKARTSSDSSGYRNGPSRSDYSIPSSNESSRTSASLVVLENPVVKDLRLEDLLRAPAELMGRGRHGTLYKVMLEDTVALAVKRIRDWLISSEDFRKRMEKIDRVDHPNVLPVLAFYSSKQERLVVYEYQQNGSLFKLLHGTKNSQGFDWGNRLGVAASIAGGLAFMHTELLEDGIAHGNLKSSNIMINNNMEALISEYGLMVIDDQPLSSVSNSGDIKSLDDNSPGPNSPFKADVYNFGVILLELLTGKPVQNNGFDLASWVNSVVREEWTTEVFDKALTMEGANEECMVNLLQVALKCVNPSREGRPSMNQVVNMILTIKEEDERSIVLGT
ncbi:hypothetical protein AAC387_Pa07g2209 [Persea americana]